MAFYHFTLARLLSGILTVSFKLSVLLSILAFGCSDHKDISASPVRMTYYVDATLGHDENDGLSVTSPWKSISRVHRSKFPAGSYILFKRGESWSEKLIVRSSGTLENPILYGAYGVGANPILSGDGVRDSSVFSLNNHYIVVQDIDLVGWTHRGLWNQGGDGWIVQRLNVEGGDSHIPDHGIRFSNTNDRKISGGLIANNRIGTIGTIENGGIFFQGILVQGNDGIIVRSNRINTANTGGITLSIGTGEIDNNKNILVEKNLIYGCTSGIAVWNTNNSIFQHNIIRDGKGFGFGVSFQSNHIKLLGNVIYNLSMYSNPTLWNGIDIANDSHYGKVYHNTIARVARHSLVLAEDGGIDLRGWDIRNNIFDASENDGTNIPGSTDQRTLPLGIRNATSFVEDHNLLVSEEDGYVASVGAGDGTLYDIGDYQRLLRKGLNSLDAEPRFIDPASGNFGLMPDSPAIGLGEINVDFSPDVTAVPFRKPPSAGAHEYSTQMNLGPDNIVNR